MQYTVNVYQKNSKKWSKINNLIVEIDNILTKQQVIKDDITKLANRTLTNLTSKRKDTNNFTWNNRYNDGKLAITTHGFAVKTNYRDNYMTIDIDLPFIKFLNERKKAIFPLLRIDKIEILKSFIRNLKDLVYAEISFAQIVNKKILMPDYEPEFTKINVVKIRAVLNENGYLEFELDNMADKVNKGIEIINIKPNDFSKNCIKEQLYLPCLKILIKARRRANKDLKKLKNAYTKITKDLEPYLVAEAV
jgi:hypothetical protein